MPDNNLSIIIKTLIDPTQTKQDIQKQLDSIKNLKINIQVDDTFLSQLNKQFQEIQKSINGFNSKGITITNSGELNNIKQINNELKNQQKLLAENSNYNKNSNAQSNLLISADQAHASYHGNIDTSALKDLVQRIKELDPASATFQKDIQKMQQELRQLKVDASETANSFTGELKHAITSMAMWSVGGGLYFSALEGLKNGISAISDSEQKMAGLQQVLPTLHDNQAAVNSAMTDFIGIAEKYGQNLTDVLDVAKLWGKCCPLYQ